MKDVRKKNWKEWTDEDVENAKYRDNCDKR